jgi:hypothetical protein
LTLSAFEQGSLKISSEMLKRRVLRRNHNSPAFSNINQSYGASEATYLTPNASLVERELLPLHNKNGLDQGHFRFLLAQVY